MNQSNDEVTCHVDTSNYEHKSTFGWSENIRNTVDITNLEIDSCNVIDD